MRNYCRFLWLNATIEDRLANGTLNGTFTNEFLGQDEDGIMEAFGIYAQAFQGSHRYSIKNLNEAQFIWIELSRDNIFKMFALLSTAFSNVVSTWGTAPGNFSGTVPAAAFFDLFVDESPRKTWSHGE